MLAVVFAPCFLAGKPRLISVADLHGDMDQTLKVLTGAGLIDPKTRAWIGGNARLVQTGDITDRGSDADHIFQLFFELAKQASRSGGRIVNLLGNHELMNIQNDLRYVTPNDVAEFGGEQARREAWSTRGWLGQHVRQFPAAEVIDGVLFAHAGPLPEVWPKQGLCALNQEMQQAVAADGQPGVQLLEDIVGDEGPVWTRVYSEDDDSRACAAVERVLAAANATRLVVGHTVQEQVRARCGGRIVLADTGMSWAYGGPASFVEHADGEAWAVYPPDTTRHRLPRPASGTPLGQRNGGTQRSFLNPTVS